MAEGGYKHIKVKHGSRTLMMPYRSHEQFIDKCKSNFGIGQDGNITFTLPDDDAELDPECINDFPNKQTLHMTIEREGILRPDQSVSEIVAGTDRLSMYQASSRIDETDTGSESNDGNMYTCGSDEFFDEDIQWFKWGDCDALQNHLEMYGTKDIASLLEDSLEGWRREPVNIAVTGQSGKGKSSLINAFLGLTVVDDGAAQVGEKETTSRCYPYNHPRYENIVFWDIPGCGTDRFPKHSYLKTINVSQYDFFLIVSSERFHKLDIWLAKEIMKLNDNNKCYLVRSKVDIDMNNRERRHKLQLGTLDSSKLFQNFRVEVKSDIVNALGEKRFIQLFLLSSHFPDKYDFESLQLRLVEDALIAKRFSLTFGMNGLTKQLLNHKKQALRSRQWRIALRSYCSKRRISLNVKFPCDINIIKTEVEFYHEQLSLNQKGLISVASSIKVKLDYLKRNIEFGSVQPVSKTSMIEGLNDTYTHRREHRSILSRLVQLFNENDMIALYSIESYLQMQLALAMKDVENLINFVKAWKESLVV